MGRGVAAGVVCGPRERGEGRPETVDSGAVVVVREVEGRGAGRREDGGTGGW